MIFLRSTMFNAFFFLSTFLLTIPTFLVSLFAPQSIMAWARFWARLEIGAAQAICGIRMEVVGLENLPPGPAIVASRHESAFDILAWTALVPAACFVVKRELTRMPLFGWLLLGAGMISVDRKAAAAAMRGLLRGGDKAKAEGRHIVIFPEGTRADPGEFPSLQPGVAALASRLGIPVVPVTTDSGSSWGRRAFRKRPGTIHIVIHKPLPPPHAREAVMTALRATYGGP